MQPFLKEDAMKILTVLELSKRTTQSSDGSCQDLQLISRRVYSV